MSIACFISTIVYPLLTIGESENQPLYFVVIVCELFFLTDIVLNFFTQDTDEAGEPLSEPLEVIAYRYLSGKFILHFIAFLPFGAL